MKNSFHVVPIDGTAEEYSHEIQVPRKVDASSLKDQVLPDQFVEDRGMDFELFGGKIEFFDPFRVIPPKWIGLSTKLQEE